MTRNGVLRIAGAVGLFAMTTLPAAADFQLPDIFCSTLTIGCPPPPPPPPPPAPVAAEAPPPVEKPVRHAKKKHKAAKAAAKAAAPAGDAAQ